ncbi:MAG: acylneuraminate cytidylyltransferase family protein [Rhodospirillaceae bacterium]
MIAERRILALIPARGGSKGLTGKNIRPLLGKPLIGWSVEQALACPEIDAVVVSTDDQAIADAAAASGAEVPFLRPPELATDTASSIDVILHAIDTLEAAGRHFDILVLLEPTSPLREVSDLSGALEVLVSTPGVESVVSVAQVENVHPAYLYRIEDGLLSPYGGMQATGVRRQTLDSLYFLEGSVYASTVAALRSRRSFYHDHTAPWRVSRYKSLEIDELCDLICAEALMIARIEGRL